jgi:AraC-like DNA-binding protein
MDVLADVFRTLRVGGVIYARGEFTPPWGMKFDTSTKAGFHAVIRGTCWLRTETRNLELHEGDVALLPHGWRHVLADSRTRPALPYRETIARQRAALRAGSSTLVICGAYGLAPQEPSSLFRQLPPIVHISAAAAGGEVADVVQRIAHEASGQQLGSEAATSRLVDLLLIYVLRAWLTTEHEATHGWLTALRDPAVAKALASLHENVARSWDLGQLARQAGVSRATLTRRFAALVGVAPLTYLTGWRMTVAARLLRETDDSMASVAASIGYESEFAFSRAFKRVRGISPASYRKQLRSVDDRTDR